MTDESPPDDAPPLDEHICFALYSTARAVTRAHRPALDALGLTYPQYLVLVLLWERDGRSVKTLGERLELDSGTLTPLLKRLESQGLVVRSRDPADERSVRIHLTPAGSEMRARGASVAASFGASVPVTDAQVRALRERLTEMHEALGRVAPAAETP